MSCKPVTIVPTSCSCTLVLVDDQGHQTSLNLHGATVRQLDWGIHIQTLNGGAKIPTASGITFAAIEALICDCHASGGGGGGGGIANVNILTDLTDDTTPITTGRVVLNGAGSWTSSATTVGIGFSVVASGNPGVTPTVTAGGATTPIFDTESGGWEVTKDQHSVLSPVTITTSAGDIVVINFTEE